LDELRTICPEFGEDFYAAITLEATLDCHDVIGGTARHRVTEALNDARRRITSASERSPVKSAKLT
jgi:argininosuccinate lyase